MGRSRGQAFLNDEHLKVTKRWGGAWRAQLIEHNLDLRIVSSSPTMGTVPALKKKQKKPPLLEDAY